MQKNRLELIEALTDSQKQVSNLLESVAGAQDWQPAPDEWSFRYVAAHMATVERDCYLNRVTRIAAAENPQFDYYRNTGWDFSQIDLRDALRLWVEARQEIIEFVQGLPEEKLLLTGSHQTFGQMSVLDALQFLLDHDQAHRQELEQQIAAYRQETIEARCRQEVVALHQFFQDWYRGRLPNTGQSFARLANVLAKDFLIIGPDANQIGQPALLDALREAHGSKPSFKIWIENVRLHRYENGLALATYQEWQQSQGSDPTARLSTVFFKDKAGLPNGLAWLHVHETWLKD